MEKVIREGKVGVLVSPGYGAGFSTWGYPTEAIFDPTLIEMVEERYKMEFVPNEKGGITQLRIWDDPKYKELTQKMIDYCESTWSDGYSGGVQDLVVAWIPEGTKFQINEYDGSESIELLEEINWITA
jgi:hypothetical protein